MPPQSPLGHGGGGNCCGVRLGQPGSLSRCLAFISRTQWAFSRLPAKHTFHTVSPITSGCFIPGSLGKREHRESYSSPPRRCPCLGCFTPFPGQGTEVAVPSLCFQPACRRRSAWSRFRSGFCVAGENDKL